MTTEATKPRGTDKKRLYREVTAETIICDISKEDFLHDSKEFSKQPITKILELLKDYAPRNIKGQIEFYNDIADVLNNSPWNAIHHDWQSELYYIGFSLARDAAYMSYPQKNPSPSTTEAKQIKEQKDGAIEYAKMAFSCFMKFMETERRNQGHNGVQFEQLISERYKEVIDLGLDLDLEHIQLEMQLPFGLVSAARERLRTIGRRNILEHQARIMTDPTRRSLIRK